VDKIFSAIFKKYNVHREDIVGPRRTKDIARARHIAVYLVHSITDMSYDNVGKVFSNRDHSTVMSSINRVKEMIDEDKMFALELEELKREIQGV